MDIAPLIPAAPAPRPPASHPVAGGPLAPDPLVLDPLAPDPRQSHPRAARTRRQRSDAKGFALLEVLVAFVIAALGLAVLYRGGTEGLHGARLAADTEIGVARARSRLTALCHGATLIPGTQSGDDGGGFTWRTEISRAASEPIEPRGGGADQTQGQVRMRADLFAVRVTISWAGPAHPHEVALETRCLTLVPAESP